MTFEEVMKEELGEHIKLSDVIDDAAIDSLEYFVFIQRLEKEFSIRLKDEDVNKAKCFYNLGVLAKALPLHAELSS